MSLTLLVAMAVTGCTTLGGAGPSAGGIRGSVEDGVAGTAIQVVELNGRVNQRLNAHKASTTFAQVFGESSVSPTIVGPGDILDIGIWEAPPAVLFGAAPAGVQLAGAMDVSSTAEIPQQQVGEDGKVTVPFVGRITVAGLRPDEIEAIIVSRLAGRANDPQALVRLVQNETRTVTVLGEVAQSGRMVLSARGERVLDALANAGGASKAIEQSTIQVARGSVQAAMPLENVIADPTQNIGLRPDDVITLQHQPYSFVALGAVKANAEVPFESRGISLAEALGRVGGLNETRANVKGVFVFRMEPSDAVDPLVGADAPTTADGRVPVVYSLRMTDAQSLFAMQDFMMQDGDVLYIATAPGVELERFLSTIASAAFTIVATSNALNSQ
ncbi:MAG: polysaccharide biosynthesis/export family protein [Erythrobacter sp.]|uniref:polysaccharide biosynthesis/export family protein n=1 Tax=Erythrobacter sp. TaxID=1042 RepID=UPI00260C71FE|nr:polysaccharide biosynthesis/export family protein [Erythrobacter sp.]MDJ0979099.1 polysaccharide biosynthesis/export family protein [Erythrobacter sp.]